MNCECSSWCRSNIGHPYNLRGKDGAPLVTNHHPDCPHYNDSLIDVWKMTVNGVSGYTDDERDIEDWKQDEFPDETSVTKEKMHREVFDNLPEFEGF